MLHLQDELAETQIPSPGYAGTHYELENEWYEYDIYEYFGELEYGGDSYWDSNITHLPKPSAKNAKSSEQSKKRKRVSAATQPSPDKRRKTAAGKVKGSSGETSQSDNVVFQSSEARIPPPAPPLEKTARFALFPDWRERFPSDADIVWQQNMPEDMKLAAESKDADGDAQYGAAEHGTQLLPGAALKATTHAAMDDFGADDANRPDNSKDVGEDDGEDLAGLLSSLDPETLKAVLKQKLGTVGLDEGAFMSTISKMLSGGGGTDEAAGELATALLGGEATAGDGSAALEWLEGQGVKLHGAGGSHRPTAEGDTLDGAASMSGKDEDRNFEPTDSRPRLRKRKGAAVEDHGDEAIEVSPSKQASRKSKGKKARLGG